MKQISSFSVILVAFCLSLIGIALMPLLPVKLTPSHTLPQLSVSFGMPSAPRVVELEVTSKLEAMLARIKGVENIQSKSWSGGGVVNVRFDKHTNIDAARFEVSTIIRQVWPFLPDGTSYPTISMSRSDDRANRAFMTYTVNAPANPIVIQRYVENNIKPKLAQIEGINKIDVTGAMPMEIRLEYDYKQLETLGITAGDIQSAISRYLDRQSMGIASLPPAKEGDNKQWIRIALTPGNDMQTAFNPSEIQVKSNGDKMISLDKIVKMNHVEAEPHSYFRINGLNSIYLSITAEENANQLEVGSKIKSNLKELEGIFPAGYEIHLRDDSTEYIHNELEKVYFRSGLTLLILLLFVLLIYRSFKYLLLIGISLFTNIAIALIFYYFGGLEMQLYSLAGITISLTLVIDNTIVISDQIIHRNNKKAFLAILTATVTTIASLVIIFFMDEKVLLNLQDFAKVIIINLAVSLFIALFLVPALIEKLNIVKGKRKKRLSYKVFVYRFSSFYASFCRFAWRWRVLFCIFIILAFGFPVFLIPDKLEGEGAFAEFYNKTISSSVYKEKIKPYSDAILGGTIRLFSQKVSSGSYYSGEKGETTIYVTATLPNGATLSQMNELVQRMESYVSQFPEVSQFQSNISARSASIFIRFTKEGEKSGFPYVLKTKLVTRSLELGGGSWSVYGVGDGFSNDVREGAGGYKVTLRGFNYDELMEWAEKFKLRLEENRRIKEVVINSEFSWYKDDYQEFSFKLNPERLVQANVQPYQLFASLQYGHEVTAGAVLGEYGREQIMLYSHQSKEYDVWSLEHFPAKIGAEKEFKLDELVTVEKLQAPQSIVKEDQQYCIRLQYEYTGSYQQGSKKLEKDVEEFQRLLPMGYSIDKEQQSWWWGKENTKQYMLLFVIFLIIYFMCSILFNSLKQPFLVIFVIPISFIGIFLTFYLFNLRFDQGGFASFILLCGLAVNTNIYILNEYNNILKKRKISPLQAYIKAWNVKITPIFLTIISTILGFIPFMVGSGKEAFWFPLAAGSIGGLIVSLLGAFCFLPLFMGVGKK
jgi:multidrug efflux pump subunit AcrB